MFEGKAEPLLRSGALDPQHQGRWLLLGPVAGREFGGLADLAQLEVDLVEV